MRTRNADAAKTPAAKRTSLQKKDAGGTAAAAPKSTPRATKATRGRQAAASPAATTPEPKVEAEVEEVETLPPPLPVDEKKPVAAVKSPVKRGGARKSPLSAKAAASKAATSKAAASPKVEPKQTEPPSVVKSEEKEEKVEIEAEKEDEVINEVEKEEEVRNEEENKEEFEDEQEMMQDKAEAKPDTTLEDEQLEDYDAEEEAAEEEKEEPMEEEFAAEEGSAEPGNSEMAVTDEITGKEGEGGDTVAVVEGDGRRVEDQEQDHDQDREGAQAEVAEQMDISDMAMARKIKKEREIFVGGLHRDATEEDVKKEFVKVGEVVEVRILKDFVTNKNKGFAFVKFATKEQASKALAELKEPMIHGKRCGIAASEDNDTLFLGNICNTWTKEAIKRKLEDYGIDTVVSITLVPDTQNEGLSRGFAFLEFPCHADAMVAYKRLQKPDVIFGHPERTAKVAFAEPLREPDPEIMTQVKSVFVDGLPPYWDEERVKEQFKIYGEIERVVLARNMSTAKTKDFGFVNFTTHDAALICIEAVNNTELGDGKTKVKSRARLANPLPKTQAVKGGMSGGFRIGYSGPGYSGPGGYSRFGRGFSRGRFPSHRAGFQGGRGFPRGRGRGRFPFAAEPDPEASFSEFRGGWRPPFQARGARHGGFERGHGKMFPSRRQPFASEEEFRGSFGPSYPGEDPYFYGDGGHGIKRPYSMMDHDPGYLEPGNRIRPRYDHPDPMIGRTHYRDPRGMTGLYSRDYYGSDYGGSTYSSFYGGEPSGRGYYY